MAKAFHSQQLQRVGGGLLLSMFMKCLGISIFRLALHSISISFRKPFKFISSMLVELIQRGNSPAMVLHRCPVNQNDWTGMHGCIVVYWGRGLNQLNPQQLLLARALINFFTYPPAWRKAFTYWLTKSESTVSLKNKQTFISRVRVWGAGLHVGSRLWTAVRFYDELPEILKQWFTTFLCLMNLKKALSDESEYPFIMFQMCSWCLQLSDSST